MSYQLADILFRNLFGHPVHRRKLREFLATADRKDSGAAACEQCFGCPLSALVAEFLGPGPWEAPGQERNESPPSSLASLASWRSYPRPPYGN